MVLFFETSGNISVSYPKFYEWLNCQNFQKSFSKLSEIPFENIRSISRNVPNFISKFFEIIFEIFRYNSQNFQKYFSKISELYQEIILRNFPKYFWKVSEVFLEISEILRNSSQKYPKYFSKCYGIILTP